MSTRISWDMGKYACALVAASAVAILRGACRELLAGLLRLDGESDLLILLTRFGMVVKNREVNKVDEGRKPDWSWSIT